MTSPAPHHHHRPPRDARSGRGYRRPSATARAFTAAGLVGYIMLSIGIVLVVIALGVAAGDHSGVLWWSIAAVVGCAVGITLLVIGRRSAASIPPEAPRPEHDPLLPEVTAEDEQSYETRFRHRDSGRPDQDLSTD